MLDREKVIKGLERCKLYNKVNCDKCPYDYNGRGDGKSECTAELASDAIALLKEQKPIKPAKCYSSSGVTWWYVCGNCTTAINPNDKYCYECGRGVKWDA